MPRIHPTAIVSPMAELADDTVVGPFCVVRDCVRIGAGTELSCFVTVLDYVEIGEKCRIEQHVVLGGEPQDLSFRGEESWVRIGNSVILREHVTIHRATGSCESTIVGDGSFLMEGVHIGHNAVVGKRVTMANKSALSGFSAIGDDAVIGGMAGLHQFVRVGALCMVGGLSKVVKDVPPYLTCDGRPATIYGLNRVGMKRAGMDSASRTLVKSIYDELFRGGLPLRAALERLAESERGDTPEAREILSFCAPSKRGVAPWTKGRSHRRGDEED
ncbi:MAG: acyl-ACP--UDP-N-acetylglucosamine O-acyltransferase [Synergistaceae bacterium]|nr:acyl-ACP--UDP-N-acetylglucosamine O-acyltransferase [Synergistaceae bacterium]